jgi:Bacterial protein of unknown function (DUF899)
MASHITGTRNEWLAARVELLAAEKELTRRRQALPWVRVDKEERRHLTDRSISGTNLSASSKRFCRAETSSGLQWNLFLWMNIQPSFIDVCRRNRVIQGAAS